MKHTETHTERGSTQKIVAIIGTRGIPNRYGGFEYFAQHLSRGLHSKGYHTLVLEPGGLISKPEAYNGVIRIPIKLCRWLPHPIQKLEYGIKSLIRVKKLSANAAICCGYSPAIFFPFFSKGYRNKLMVNLDGLEWQRAKWSAFGKTFLKISERLAVRWSGTPIADNPGISQYIQQKYNVSPKLLSYGVCIPEETSPHSPLALSGFEPNNYGLAIARMEPENQIELIIQAFLQAKKPLIVVGGLTSKYAKDLFKRYHNQSSILFMGPLYHDPSLQWLRKNARIYVHGHSVGGTNPSLLQAMASGCTIVAHNNEFNRFTLDNAGFYFNDQKQLQQQIENLWDFQSTKGHMAKERASELFSWEKVTDGYVELIESIG